METPMVRPTRMRCCAAGASHGHRANGRRVHLRHDVDRRDHAIRLRVTIRPAPILLLDRCQCRHCHRQRA